MAGGTKRLPRAVREQQMLDAAVDAFARNGFHDTSMDAIAAAAKISKPMLYLYYGSKEELFAACIHREGLRFVEAIAPAGNPNLTPHEQVRVALKAFLDFVDQNRRSWRVLYRQAIAQQAFASQVESSRERLIELTAKLLESSTKNPDPNTNFNIMAVALIGAGEAVADRLTDGQIEVDEALELLDNLAWRGLAGKKKEPAGGPSPADPTDPDSVAADDTAALGPS
jgi:AcrR family transcriptional regulator